MALGRSSECENHGLGLAWGHSLTLDATADGAGWFVDSAPWQPAAFAAVPARSSRQMDLLTVVAHEVGHLLGYNHSESVSDVMAATLPVGTGRVPAAKPYAARLVGTGCGFTAARARIAVECAQHELVDHPLLARTTNRLPTPRRGCSPWCPKTA